MPVNGSKHRRRQQWFFPVLASLQRVTGGCSVMSWFAPVLAAAQLVVPPLAPIPASPTLPLQVVLVDAALLVSAVLLLTVASNKSRVQAFWLLARLSSLTPPFPLQAAPPYVCAPFLLRELSLPSACVSAPLPS